MARKWADLPQELLELCSQSLCPKDLSAFRAVCHSWRSAAIEERSGVPWLMLAAKKATRRRKFFCLSCQRVHKVLQPKANANQCFSSRGWVLTIMSKGRELHMLKNPLSPHNRIIKLPGWNMSHDIAKFVLSDSPTASPDYRVMVVHNSRLGLWKPGNTGWIEVNCPGPSYCFWDVISFKGYFLALDKHGRIWRCDADGPTQFEAQAVFRVPKGRIDYEHAQLVESTTRSSLFLVKQYLVRSTTGSLLFVSRWDEKECGQTFRFYVFEIDLDTQTFVEVKSLENTSLFLGWNSSFSLEVDGEHHIKPNCVYFTYYCLPWPLSRNGDEKGGGSDMGIYHLEDGTIERFKEKSHRPFYPPLWIEPGF